MKRLPPAKRQQLIGVLVATLGLICIVYFVLIHPQNDKNDKLAVTIKNESARLQLFQKTILQMEASSNALVGASLQLDHAEADVASGDLYAWAIDVIRRFKTPYHVDIPNVGQPSAGDCELLGGFPYKQIRFSLSGSAYYHDLGKFVADFENKFVHCRVVNLSLEPSGEPAAGEKLNFKMDVIALVKPNN